MRNIKCPCCDLLLPQNTLNPHMRSKHIFPKAIDVANFPRHFAVPMAAPPKEIPKHVPNIIRPKAAAEIATPSKPAPTLIKEEGGKLFFDWLKSNTAKPSNYVRVDDVVCSRAVHAYQPQKMVVALQKAVRYDVHEIVDAFDGLPSGVQKACYDYARTVHVFPALTTFVFLHLSLCSPNDDRLWHFKMSMRAYKLRSEEWCILHYAKIRDFLYSLYLQTPVDHHICNQRLVGNNQLHILDIQHLGAQVASFLVNPDRAKSFYETIENSDDSEDIGQSMVDLLQALLDLQPCEFDEWYRPCFLSAVIRLTRKALVYPSCLEIKGVDGCAKTGGEGGFGVIHKGSLLGRTVALKKLKDQRQNYDKLTKNFAHEAVLWRNVNHANCLPFYGIFKGDDGDLYLVSPWMERGDLSVYLSKHPSVDRLPLIYDIARGLEYLHKMQPTIVHGDLTCFNIFITSTRHACIADFGLSNLRDFSTKANSSMTVGGTPGFIAPELYLAQSDEQRRNFDLRRCDMFAFGIVIYQIHAGEQSKLMECVIRDGSRPPRPHQELCRMHGLDDDIWELIKNLWTQDPDARLVAESVRGFVGYKLRAKNEMRSSRTGKDPEWDLDFLTSVGVATSPFELCGPIAM